MHSVVQHQSARAHARHVLCTLWRTECVHFLTRISGCAQVVRNTPGHDPPEANGAHRTFAAVRAKAQPGYHGGYNVYQHKRCQAGALDDSRSN
jgi:hypothetical protein